MLKKYATWVLITLFTVLFTPFFVIGMVGALLTDGYKMADWAYNQFAKWVGANG